jgi:ABC-type branched-subunit amino acid transport system substrate-binding protein
MSGLWRVYNRLARRAKAGVAGLCVVLLAAVGFGAYEAYGALFPGTCASGGSTYLVPSGPTGDCVGYTDGGYVFDKSLESVEQDIRRENQQVTAQHPSDYVSVVMLLPISAKVGSIMSMPDVLDHLHGAYTAQHYANRNDVKGNRPYIRLLIGNAGYQANQWSKATSVIKGAVTSQHIAAVTGLGVSLATTKAAAEALTSAGIPVIGSTMSSDDFDDIRNLIRVTPSNKEEISVADAYAKASFKRAILVQDENEEDIYDSTLVQGFKDFQDAHHTIIGTEPYDTTYRDEPGSAATEQQGDAVVRNEISQMTSNICIAQTSQPGQPAVVLFAGRGRDLAELISDLANRTPCQDMPITIVTGDDVVNMPYSSKVRQGLASKVNVDYSGDADQDEWTTGTGPAVTEGRQGFTTFKTTFQELFPGISLADENLMMSYDATLTAISAIRLTHLPQPGPNAVAADLSALHGTHTVYGASGPLAFNTDWQDNPFASNPVGKPVPMLALKQDGARQFLTLNWPDGQPPSY